MNSKTWENCASAYLQHLKAAGRANGTIRIHRYYLQVMRGIAPCPGLVSRERLEAWLAEHDWKPETRRSAQGVAHQFFKFLVEDDILKDSPAKFLKPVHDCTVTLDDYGRATVKFDEPQRAVTSGQSVVFYDENRLIGGGTIIKPL